jgi:hypothetical protein
MEVKVLSHEENTKQVALADEQGVEDSKILRQAPKPSAIGTDRIEILHHQLSVTNVPADGANRARPSLEFAIRNVSTSTIATMMFEADLYDGEGNVLDTIKQKEVALEPDRSRAIFMNLPPYYDDKIQSYAIRVSRTTTADIEKVQLRRHDISTTETGEEEITGIVKNISQVKTDAAVVATFFDAKEQNIGTMVMVLKDIEPDTVRKYSLKFRPQEGDSVRTHHIEIGEIAG